MRLTRHPRPNANKRNKQAQDPNARERVFLVGVETPTKNQTNKPRGRPPAIKRRAGGLATPALPQQPSPQQQDAEPAPEPKTTKKSLFDIAASLEELARLADTAGLEVVGTTSQRLDPPNPKTYIGKGKVEEVRDEVQRLGVDTVIFDDTLTPAQLRALESELGGEYEVDGVDFLGRRSSSVRTVRVCDRTALILDIFNQRAGTKEAALQVQIASIDYQLPRLTRMWTHLERQSGSGQLKGMGEKQIEVDRRVLKEKRASIQRQLKKTRQERFYRKHQRGGRKESRAPVVALVGYTNAGKSTLLNALTKTQRPVFAEDKLFATLDPTSRKLRLPTSGGEVVLTDTVGFVQKLPTELVEAFRATLEEVITADVILRVVDISDPAAAAQLDAVDTVLNDLFAGYESSTPPRWQRKWLAGQGLGLDGEPLQDGDAGDDAALGEQPARRPRPRPPTISIWNKLDAAAEPDALVAMAARVGGGGAVCVSATEGVGLEDLLAKLEQALEANGIDPNVPGWARSSWDDA